MENDDFEIPPPDFSQGDYQTPFDQRAAMTLKLIKTKLDSTLLPPKVKSTIYNDMTELVNNSSMTNISLGQVKEFLGDFDYIWMTYETFINRIYRKELNYIKSIIRTIFKQNLNKSKEGFYSSLVFEQRYKYDIKQEKAQPEEKVRRFFRGRKQEEHMER